MAYRRERPGSYDASSFHISDSIRRNIRPTAGQRDDRALYNRDAINFTPVPRRAHQGSSDMGNRTYDPIEGTWSNASPSADVLSSSLKSSRFSTSTSPPPKLTRPTSSSFRQPHSTASQSSKRTYINVDSDSDLEIEEIKRPRPLPSRIGDDNHRGIKTAQRVDLTNSDSPSPRSHHPTPFYADTAAGRTVDRQALRQTTQRENHGLSKSHTLDRTIAGLTVTSPGVAPYKDGKRTSLIQQLAKKQEVRQPTSQSTQDVSITREHKSETSIDRPKVSRPQTSSAVTRHQGPFIEEEGSDDECKTATSPTRQIATTSEVGSGHADNLFVESEAPPKIQAANTPSSTAKNFLPAFRLPGDATSSTPLATGIQNEPANRSPGISTSEPKTWRSPQQQSTETIRAEQARATERFRNMIGNPSKLVTGDNTSKSKERVGPGRSTGMLPPTEPKTASNDTQPTNASPSNLGTSVFSPSSSQEEPTTTLPQETAKSVKHTGEQHASDPAASYDPFGQLDLPEYDADPPEYDADPFGLAAIFPNEYAESKEVQIPTSFRKDLQHVTSQSIEQNAEAGATRDIIGRATKNGFIFNQYADEDASVDTPTKADGLFDGSSILDQSSPGDDDPISMHRYAEQKKATRSETSREPFYTPLLNIDDYIRDGAKRGLQAGHMAQRINSNFGYTRDRKWTGKRVQVRAKELTGLHIIIKRDQRDKRRGQKSSQSKGDASSVISQTPSKTLSNAVSEPERTAAADDTVFESPFRPKEGIKRPVTDWKRRYATILKEKTKTRDENQESDTEESDEEYDYSPIEPRPVHVYTVFKSVHARSDHDQWSGTRPKIKTGEEAEEEDPEAGAIHMGEYVNLSDAKAKALDLTRDVLASCSDEGMWHYKAGSDHDGQEDCYTYSAITSDHVVRIRVKRSTQYDQAIRRPGPEALRRERWIYEVLETVQEVREPMLEPSSVQSTSGERGNGPADAPGETQTDSADDAGDMVDLFGEEAPSGEGGQDSTAGSTSGHGAEKASAGADEPAASPLGEQAGGAPPETRLIKRGAVTDEVYNTLQEANAVAAKYIYDCMVEPYAPRSLKLDVPHIWKARRKVENVEMRKICDAQGEGVAETKLLRGMLGEEWTRYWTVEVVKRAVRGPLN